MDEKFQHYTMDEKEIEVEEAPILVIMPRDWTPKQKWNNVVLISFQAAFTPIASTLLAAGTSSFSQDFGLTDTFSPNLPIGLFLLALGIGPLFLGPLSEMYGRRMIYIVNFSLFAVLNLACGFATNIYALSILRFLSGLAGSAASTLSGATVGDMFVPAERAKAQAIYGATPVLGPVIGGILGGYIVHLTGTWRWSMWIMGILPALSAFACVFFLRETYAPFIMRKHGIIDPVAQLSNVSTRQRFAVALLRPLRLLIFSPICTIMAVYVGIGYATYYFHVVTVPLIFGSKPVGHLFSYEWNSANTGLAYLGIGIGSMIGVVIAATTMSKCYLYCLRKMADVPKTEDLVDRLDKLEWLFTTGSYKDMDCEHCCCAIEDRLNEIEEETDGKVIDCPEARLPFMGIAAVITPAGMIIFAWTVSPSIPWIVPLIGAGIFAGGIIMTYISIQNYLVDTFDEYAASALAATSLLRSPLACGLSLVSVEAYETLNYNWGTMLLAFILIGGLPIPLVLFHYGKYLRTMGRMS